MNRPETSQTVSPVVGKLRLRAREEKRIRAGHLWVFSNEIDQAVTPLKAFEPGQFAVLETSRGNPVGLVCVNPHSLICARIMSRNATATIDQKFVQHRLASALALREAVFARPYYRLCYGEADGLPGLVVDRYGDYLVVQITTAGIEAIADLVLDALESLLSPKGILLRNDSAIRELEGLPQTISVVRGEVPDEVEIDVEGLRITVPVRNGQKTGWFYDQRGNRQALRQYASGRRVLDVFCYIGGWGLNAAAAGASSVVCVDASKPALEYARKNAAQNDLDIECRHGDAFDLLGKMSAEKQRFDLVVVDPPALIKRRKDQKKGEAAYARLARLAIQTLDTDGVLVFCSCSRHLGEDELLSILRRAAQSESRRLQILEIRGQSLDHPIHPAIPETRYLKAVFCRVI